MCPAVEKRREEGESAIASVGRVAEDMLGEVWHSCGLLAGFRQDFLWSFPWPSRPPQTPQRNQEALPGSSPSLWPDWPHLLPLLLGDQ